MLLTSVYFTIHTEPETEQTPGRTATAKPTNREHARAKAAAAERETKEAQTTSPEKEREEEKPNKKEQKTYQKAKRRKANTRENPKGETTTSLGAGA